ncbi:pilus assembly protein [Ferrimonas pelagia]|uniref:Pilus assembly protein n=2 Tax=Ferrimonas pelagia TaxID=1177826 RepID=A0ABP9EKJ6_9GAMM
MLLNKTRLQNAVDAAALSSAVALDQGKTQQIAKQEGIATLAGALSAGDFSQLDDAIELTGLNYATADLSSQITVEFSLQPDPFIPTTDPTADYVRILVDEVNLASYLARIMTFDKWISASAVSGPSTAIDFCNTNVLPMTVCLCDTADCAAAGDSASFGYPHETLMAMKLASSNDTDIGPGNFRLLDFEGLNGANGIRDAFAGKYTGEEFCFSKTDDSVVTKPGNNVGPTAQGLNTRLGIYLGQFKKESDTYPRDKSTCVGEELAVTEDRDVIYEADKNSDAPVDVNDEPGGLYRHDDYDNDYSNASASSACLAGGWDGTGGDRRREFAIVVSDCSGEDTGKSSLPFEGFACFFMSQEVVQTGTDNFVIGEFLNDCTGNGSPSYDTSDNDGPYQIVLYRNPSNKDS